ncbi:exodeoxyribonuclease VII large subunit [Psittacicella hinzii]|uniref:Exodeoxyribonuclease 7 large subunit n=1 Tax=Psittacicella hinzii TaxID=2028575 RepID=A0A3A1YUA9_9GAMM|nr:exodeoxyribonuclease VII large subunit [Psittacicella hinzii]RIY40460.1 exodeoxyribonuclease VII large subunit [Psittacicella hinzii]
MDLELDFQQVAAQVDQNILQSATKPIEPTTVPEVKEKTVIRPISVSQLLSRVADQFKNNFWGVYIEAEISSLKFSGKHAYLTLKDIDGDAQINANLWNYVAAFADFEKRMLGKAQDFCEGAKVEVYGELTVYPPRGTMQLTIARMRLAGGMGEQLLRIQKLKQQIIDLGWRNPAYKKPIPQFPKVVGLVTSNNAAGFKDMCNIFAYEAPDIQLINYDCNVQGANAVSSIVQAIATANQEQRCEVLIVGRGGGSFEDLLAFYDEQVVQAVFNSQIPIISAVGHEIDNPLTDLVADFSCVTPTAAAKSVSYPRVSLRNYLYECEQKIQQFARFHLGRFEQKVRELDQRVSLCDPQQVINNYHAFIQEGLMRLEQAYVRNLQNRQQYLMHLEQNIQLLTQGQIAQKQHFVTALRSYVQQYNPERLIPHYMQQLGFVRQALTNVLQQNIAQKQTLVQQMEQYLQNQFNMRFHQRVQELTLVNHRLMSINVQHMLTVKRQEVEFLVQRLQSLAQQRYQQIFNQLEHIVQKIQSLDPQAPLERGYAMLMDQQQVPISSVEQISLAQNFNILLQDGQVSATATSITPQAQPANRLKQAQIMQKLEQVIAQFKI